MSFDAFLTVVIGLGVCFFIATKFALAAVNEHFRHLSYQKHHGHLYYGVLLSLLAAGFYVLGLGIMAAYLSAGQEAAVIIAVIMLGIAWACWRRKKHRLISRLACLGLAVLAFLLLAAAF